MKKAIFIPLMLLSSAQLFADGDLDRGETITIISDFREQQQNLYAGSITVLDDSKIEDSAEQHFEELINWVPNLNFAGGTSRPRFFQIRGIGERSQYQGAPNPSVGFIVDDIDFSGIGGIATLFDVEQIEVLRGPQGAHYGANALAGLVYIKTIDPTDEFNGHAQLTYAQDNTFSLGVAAGGAMTEELSYRFAIQQHQSDGFRENAFLNRSDTNGKKELTARLKLLWKPSENFSAKFTFINIDLDNGYDAWAADNSLIVHSDKPGRDEQQTSAISAKLIWDGNQNYSVTSITSFANSDILFSFDGDWANPDFWGVNGPYDFNSETKRNRRTLSQEVRVVSKPGAEIFSGKADWLVGIYGLKLDEDNQILDLFNGGIYNALNTDYKSSSAAVFAQIDYHLSDVTSIKTGLRIENRTASYRDSNDQDLSPDETMFGGHITLEHLHGNGSFSYATVSRGYKAGGFNIGTNLPAQQIEFDAEFLWNFEIGMNVHWLDEKLSTHFSMFYMKRDEQQVETSFQLDPTDPLTFIFATDNAATGKNYGLELQTAYHINNDWSLFSNLGLLKTEFDDSIIGTRNLKGRAQAHAPKYSYATGLNYRNQQGVFGLLEITGKDEFFFSDSHDQVSKSYNLVNVKFGYEQPDWSVYLWGKNILDKAYSVRGFFFANEPPDWIDTLYTRQGEPAYWGITAKVKF